MEATRKLTIKEYELMRQKIEVVREAVHLVSENVDILSKKNLVDILGEIFSVLSDLQIGGVMIKYCTISGAETGIEVK